MTSAVEREAALGQWARTMLVNDGFVLEAEFRLRPASDDASFRRYFRGSTPATSFIFVDAPPYQEDSRPFIAVSRLLAEAGLAVPVVYHVDLDLGFMMLTDMGDSLYLGALAEGDEARSARLYDAALTALLQMQKVPLMGLPEYDAGRLGQEMHLFTDWFLPKQLGLAASVAEKRLIADVFDRLIVSAMEQPQVFVHRDYHSRNLMILPGHSPGILDFQDAVAGPATYDLVSLLRDCYHRLPPAIVASRVEAFRVRAIDAGILPHVEADAFRRWFDWMGMQRHLKVAGIFSRLNLRDGKPRYLADIPLVVDYLKEVADHYDEFTDFSNWLDERVLPLVAPLRSRP
jgi:N-acetylmuramate 1-kinase